MRARVFVEHPEDVQEAVVYCCWLFECGPSIRGRCMAIDSACVPALKGDGATVSGGWHQLGAASEWREQVEAAGLDPDDPLRVVNQVRWDNAWAQLIETGTFRDDVAARDHATGKRSPRAEARVKAIAVRAKKPGPAVE